MRFLSEIVTKLGLCKGKDLKIWVCMWINEFLVILWCSLWHPRWNVIQKGKSSNLQFYRLYRIFSFENIQKLYNHCYTFFNILWAHWVDGWLYKNEISSLTALSRRFTQKEIALNRRSKEYEQLQCFMSHNNLLDHHNSISIEWVYYQ